MESEKTVLLGYNAFPYRFHKPLPNATDDDRLEYFSSKINPYGRLLLALVQYLTQYTQYFDRINFVMTYEQDIIWPNGTLEGLLKKINHSEIDVGVIPAHMNKDTTHAVDFAYPYELDDYTFVTRKPEYKPHIFGIFQMFSLPVWLWILSVLISMPIVNYAILKRKYTFNTISFHVLAILMKQNSMIRPSSVVEKLLVYSWVVGSMILCLSYDSVFLSFLSIPPLTKIKTLLDLALAVESGDYNCISHLLTIDADNWKNSKQQHLSAIATNSFRNKLSYGNPFTNFIRESQNQNIAFILQTKFLDILDDEKFFVSEDRFRESMFAMMVRKGFCCKELLDSFVHRIMASGLFFKYASDGSFASSMGLKSLFPDPETTNRKLTLTDVAPAFIFLVSGYFMSLMVLILEMQSGRKEMISIKINEKRKRRQVYDESLV